MADRLWCMLRGGSWFSKPPYCRAASRISNLPGYRSDNVGFRVACSEQGDGHPIPLEETDD